MEDCESRIPFTEPFSITKLCLFGATPGNLEATAYYSDLYNSLTVKLFLWVDIIKPGGVVYHRLLPGRPCFSTANV